jgi:hypothetical protein
VEEDFGCMLKGMSEDRFSYQAKVAGKLKSLHLSMIVEELTLERYKFTGPFNEVKSRRF